MARRFAKVSEEDIEEAFFIHLISVSVYIHHYSPPLQGIVVYYLILIHVIRLGNSV